MLLPVALILARSGPTYTWLRSRRSVRQSAQRVVIAPLGVEGGHGILAASSRRAFVVALRLLIDVLLLHLGRL